LRTAIDTNIISTLWSEEPAMRDMAAALTKARREGSLVIAAPVYAELLAHPGASEKLVHDFLAKTEIVIDFQIPEQVWRLAGRRYAAYAERRRASAGGHPRRLLVDFLIGAHAFLSADRLLTRDAERYSHDFPKLRMM
jgi:predicted nucleic acid-binding protein